MGSQFEGAQSITVGKAWWQDCEAVGHIVFRVRKQREKKAVQVKVLSCLPSSHLRDNQSPRDEPSSDRVSSLSGRDFSSPNIRFLGESLLFGG